MTEIAQNDAQGKIHSITVLVPANHRLLQLKKALDWDAIGNVVHDYLRLAGRNVDGVLRGRRLNVGIYVPMIVLMLVMRLNLRQMEAFLSENAVARLFMDLGESRKIQVRDHSTIGRIMGSLGAVGLEELNALILRHAVSLGFADTSTLSADTTAQELAIGYPHEAGILRGLADRCLRAHTNLSKYGKRKLSAIKKNAIGLVRKAKEYHLFAKTQERKDAILQGMVGQASRLLGACGDVAARLSGSSERGVQSAVSVLKGMQEVGGKLLPQIKSWLRTGKVAKDKIVHVGLPMARSIVRNKVGKKVEFGIQYLIAAIGGGYLIGRAQTARIGENQMPMLALKAYQETFGRAALPELAVYDRGGWSQENVSQLKKSGIKKIGIQPKGRARWRVHGKDRKRVMLERAAIEGKIGTLKTSYGMNKPRERRSDTVLAVGPKSILSFNLNKMMRDVSAEKKKAV